MVSAGPAAWAFVVAVFLAAAAGGAALWMMAASAAERRARRGVTQQLERLEVEAGPAAAALGSLLRGRSGRETGWTRSSAYRLLRLRQVEVLIEQAESPWTVELFLGLTAGLGLAAGALGLLVTGAPYVGLAGAALGAALPLVLLRRRRAKRLSMLEEQLPEAVDLLGRSIRAGHALTIAFRMVAEESPEPIAGEFRRLSEEQRYGMPFEDAVAAMTERVPLPDMRIFGTAVLIQREVGGNLTEILDKLSYLIRQRFTLQRQVMVFTAEGRLSAVILGLLPTAIGLLLYLSNPDYVMGMFEHPLGRVLAGGAFGMQVLGYLWARRLTRLDF
ncbi:MAG TPA: type II secretion system F family protein [Longimicrobiaceae bacterium]|nr:type II secretion system F family protein [Longimicrobiaceae bacterium]